MTPSLLSKTTRLGFARFRSSFACRVAGLFAAFAFAGLAAGEERLVPGDDPVWSGPAAPEPPHAPPVLLPGIEAPSASAAPDSPDFIEVPGGWNPQGPGPIADGQVEGMTNKYVCGAIHTVVAHPTNPDIVYIGAVNGGVWKTTNATAANPTWTTTMDGMPSLSIGALAFDPLDATSATVWAGVGRFSSYARFGGSRSGLYRTTDGGATWTNLTGGGVLVGKNISGLVVRGNTILVSVNTADVGGNSNYGVWRSTNGGATFTQTAVGDGTGPTGLPEGVSYDIVSSPSAPDTIYTCIAFPTTSSAKGIYKSTDLGATWTRVSPASLNNRITGATSNIEMSAGGAGNVAAGILESGAPVGIFHSADAGASWQEMDNPTVPNVAASTFNIASATDTSPIVVGTTASHGYSTGDFVEVSGATGNTAANGTWRITVLSSTGFSLDSSAGNGTYGGGGKVRKYNSMFAVSGATNASPIVVTTDAAHGLSTNHYVEIAGVTGNTAANGIHQITVLTTTTFSLDFSTGNGAYASGGTATRVTSMNPRGSKGPEEGTPEEIAGGQGSIHFSIVVDPTDPNLLYVGGDRQDAPFPNFLGGVNYSGNLWRGDASRPRDGASPSSQWRHLTHSNAVAAIPGGGTSNNSSPHADSRDMAIDAAGNLLEVDDGGVFRRTSPRTNTGAWTSMAGNLQVTEAHNVTYDTVSGIIITGNQDNGTSAQNSPGSLGYTAVSTGDGGDVAAAVNPANSSQSIRYSSFQNLGSFRRRVMSSANTLVSQNFPALAPTGGAPAISGQFTTPVEINSKNGNRLLIGGSNGTFESLDQGATVAQISTLAPADGLTSGRTMVYGGAKSGAPNEELVYFARSLSIYRRVAAGVAPAAVSGYTGSTVRSIVADPEDYDHLFAIDSNQVFRSTDGGASFTDITGDIPAAAKDFRSLEFIRNGANWAVVVGTSRGVHAARNSAVTDWGLVGTGMPNVPVWDMDYDADDNLLVVSTLGRGVWAFPVAREIASGQPQTITFDPIPDQFVTNVLILAATGGGSGNPVTFAVTAGPATIAGGNQLSFTGTGTVTITASQAGNANYEPAPDVSRTFAVTKTPATVTLTPASLSQVYDGTPRPVAYTTNPTGLSADVTYNGSPTAPAGVGSYAVVATINSPLYQGSTSGTLDITKINATVTLSNLSQWYDGTPRPVTVTTVPPGLPLTVTYNGSATVPFVVGSYAIVATVNDPIYQGSATGTLQIAKQSQTINFPAIPNQVVTATPTVSATGGASGQPVLFEVTDGPATLGVGNMLAFSGAGVVSVRATQAGTANFDPAPPVTRTFQVTRVPATLTLSNLNQVYSGVPSPIGVATNPAGLGHGILYDGLPTVPVEPGSYAVIAYIDEEHYEGDTSATLVIAKAPQIINFPSPPSVDALQSVSLSATGGPTGNPVTFEVFAGPGVINGGNQLSFTAAGSVTVRARQAGNARYLDAAPVDRTISVAKAPASVSLVSLAHTYDGSAKSPDATTDPPGLAVAFTYNGSAAPAIDAGEYAVLASIDDPRYAGGASATLVIAKAAQAIDFSLPPGSLANAVVLLSATGGGSGNAVVFGVAGGPASIQGGNQLVFSGAGDVAVTASQEGDANYLAASPVTRALAVTKAPATAARLLGLRQVFDGSPREVEVATEPPGLAAQVTYDGSADPPVGVGSYGVEAELDDPIYEGSVSGVLVVDDPGRMERIQGGSLPALSALGALDVATFQIGRYEVTWSLWALVRDWAVANGYDLGAVGAGCEGDHPVSGVNWFDAVKWCNARTEWENATFGTSLAPAYRVAGAVYRTGEPASADEVACDPGTSGYRLPAAAEREFAARGGTASAGHPYPGGLDPLALAWHVANSAGATCDLGGGRGTWPAGALHPNELGLHDLSGNLAEWAGDALAGSPARRAVLGGGWDSSAAALLLSALGDAPPDGRTQGIGFRVARSVSAAVASAVDGAGLDWDSGGESPWFAQTGETSDGIDAAAGGALEAGRSNWVETTASGVGNVLFRWRLRLPAEEGALIVLVDGVERARITGETGWLDGSVHIPGGVRTVRWVYERVAPGAGGPPAPAPAPGADGAWLDEVAFVPATIPSVETTAVTAITEAAAASGGAVADDGGAPLAARGVVVSTDPAPEVGDGTVFADAGTGTGAFASALSPLLPGTTYRVRAYATNGVGTAYGAERIFTTDETVPFVDGIAERQRVIESGDRHVFHFTLSGPRAIRLSTSGGAALRAELRDASGVAVAAFEGDSDFDFDEALFPGAYSLHVFRGADGGAAQAYTLDFDATALAETLPDVAVGASAASLVGVGVRGGAGQVANLVSWRASPVAALARIANGGRLADKFLVRGGGGARLFGVRYTGDGGNITAALLAGRHRTPALDAGDEAVSIRVEVTPDRKELRKRVGKRTVTLRRAHTVPIVATSVFDGAAGDSARIHVSTR